MALQTVYNTNHQVGQLDLLTAMVAADAGLTDWWVNTGNELVVINNAGGSGITVTENLGTNASVDGLTPTARTKSIAAGKWAILGPYPPTIYNNTANSFMTLGWSAVTSVKLLVFIKNS